MTLKALALAIEAEDSGVSTRGSYWGTDPCLPGQTDTPRTFAGLAVATLLAKRRPTAYDVEKVELELGRVLSQVAVPVHLKPLADTLIRKAAAIDAASHAKITAHLARVAQARAAVATAQALWDTRPGLCLASDVPNREYWQGVYDALKSAQIAQIAAEKLR